jgi:hypothetical protein
MRTRMSGGVGGARSCEVSPYPDPGHTAQEWSIEPALCGDTVAFSMNFIRATVSPSLLIRATGHLARPIMCIASGPRRVRQAVGSVSIRRLATARSPRVLGKRLNRNCPPLSRGTLPRCIPQERTVTPVRCG